jgi:ADP-ribose pyrophosphatase YjhB (NUDIX family)
VSSIPPQLLRVADRLRRIVWRVYGPRTIGIRGIVVDERGHVLLVRHSYGPPTWHLPGGGVKRRESLLEALGRELREEVGVTVTGRPELHGVFSNMTEGKSDHITVFVVRQWRGAEADSAEIDSARFFDPATLPDEVSPGTRRRLDEWHRGDAPAGFSW